MAMTGIPFHLLALLVFLLSPWWVLKREFGGVGVLVGPWGVINPQSLALPEGLAVGWVGWWAGVWLLLSGMALGVMVLKPAQRRAYALYGLGILGLLLFLVGLGLFYQMIGAVNGEALAQGVAAARLPLKRASPSLAAYASGFYSLGLLLLGRLQLPGSKAFLVKRRQMVVPLVAMGLAVMVGAVVVWMLRPGLGSAGVELSAYERLVGKLDLVTYTFQLMFGAITSLPGLFQSLLLATPLMFTGLAVAFAFHGGLFNIGAPGQLTMGAIATMLVGVYLPGPTWLVLPLAIAAAALGGAIWGGIPGWLKARFGTHEVINTIMLNYIASSLFLFLISANQYSFFGYEIELPFKAAGPEARSEELRPAARLPLLLTILGRQGSEGSSLTWAIPLALLLGLLVYGWLRALPWQTRLAATAVSLLAGYGMGSLLPPIPVTFSPALTSVRLNGSFFIALVAVLGVNLYLWRTKGGYELRATGLSPKAAEYAGVNLAQKMVLAMAVSGALAGLAATHYVLGSGIDEYRLKQSLPTSVGFDGIAVALMGQNSPLGIALTSFLFGVLLTGGLQLNLELGISRELVTTLQALIVLFMAAGGFLPSYFRDPLQAAQVEMEAHSPLTPESLAEPQEVA
ncbi:MAG: ABC transporter permease [Cyanobacteriota bacterium]|nr:ABC transporter permease [Cyanobacteriota bacterium]